MPVPRQMPASAPRPDAIPKRPLAALPTGPQILGRPFLKLDDERGRIRLTARQREQLIQIGTRLRLPRRTCIYEEESTANSVYVVTEGAVKSYRDLPSGKRSLCAFLFEKDLFGLAEQGRYVNTTQSITSVTVYRLPVGELAEVLKHDSELQFQFLMKVTHELREAQRRAIMINRKDAPGRLAMFIAMMHDRLSNGGARVPLPMSRSDIAAFLGLSLESVSRAAAELERRGLVTFEGRHSATIVHPVRMARIVAAV